MSETKEEITRCSGEVRVVVNREGQIMKLQQLWSTTELTKADDGSMLIALDTREEWRDVRVISEEEADR